MTAPDVSAKSQRLSWLTKIAYGAGDVGAGMTSNLIAFFSLFFLVDVAGLSQAAAGLVSLIGRFWDGINDPLIGTLSDRTRTRWGRRYPWIVTTMLPFGLSFVMMWLVPGFGNPIAKVAYFAIAYILFQTFFTTTNLPYTTLTAELSQDYDDRTELTAFRLAFSVGGAVLVLVLGLVFSQQFPERLQLQYGLLASICAIVAMLALGFCVLGTYGRSQQQAALLRRQGRSLQEGTHMPLVQQLRVVLSTRPFLYVVGLYLCSWMALQITAAVIPFYVKSWMQMPQTTAYTAALLVQGTAIPLMFVCNGLSRRWGKRGLYFAGTGSWLIVQAGLFFVQPNQVGLLYGLCVAASFGVATTYVVPWSILPDVVELDEVKTGERREGLFYSFMTLLQKLGLGLGVAMVSFVLELTGYVSANATQPPAALLAVRLAIGPLPMLLLIGGLVFCYFYPITREIHAEILLQLAEKSQDEPRESA